MPFLDAFRRPKPDDDLIALPAEDQPAGLDEEEERALRFAWPIGFIDEGQRIVTDLGLVIEGERAASFRRGLAADSLARVAERRLRRGDTAGALSTCAKSLAMWKDDYDAWLVLGQVYAQGGEAARAKRALKEAEQAARRRGVLLDSAYWTSRAGGLRSSLGLPRHEPR